MHPQRLRKVERILLVHLVPQVLDDPELARLYQKAPRPLASIFLGRGWEQDTTSSRGSSRGGVARPGRLVLTAPLLGLFTAGAQTIQAGVPLARILCLPLIAPWLSFLGSELIELAVDILYYRAGRWKTVRVLSGRLPAVPCTNRESSNPSGPSV